MRHAAPRRHAATMVRHRMAGHRAAAMHRGRMMGRNSHAARRARFTNGMMHRSLMGRGARHHRAAPHHVAHRGAPRHR
jgi:hypothetical protein